MTTTGRAAFAAAMRVIDRVHDNATNVRALAFPAITTGFSQCLIAVVRIRYSADRCPAFLADHPNFAGCQAQESFAGITAN